MDLYKKWLNECRYLIIKSKNKEIIEIIKTNEKIDSTKTTGYFGIYYSDIFLHIYYVDVKKCKFVNNLLKDAYKFDYYNFNYRLRKDKLNMLNNINS